MTSSLASLQEQVHHLTAAGHPFDQRDSRIMQLKDYAARQCQRYNAAVLTENNYQPAILRQLFHGIGAEPYIEPNFLCTFGFNITLGDDVFFNHDVIIEDYAPVTFGNDINVAPRVGIYPLAPVTPGNPYVVSAKPVTIGNGVWLGGSVTITGGVTIGDNTIVAAGSVVRSDLPANVIAAGNPARVIRRLATN